MRAPFKLLLELSRAIWTHQTISIKFVLNCEHEKQ